MRYNEFHFTIADSFKDAVKDLTILNAHAQASVVFQDVFSTRGGVEPYIKRNIKKSRHNSVSEKRRMRNARIKRKRAAIKSLQSSTKPPRAHASIPIVQESKKVVTESELAEKNELEKKVNLYKRMPDLFGSVSVQNLAVSCVVTYICVLYLVLKSIIPNSYHLLY